MGVGSNATAAAWGNFCLRRIHATLGGWKQHSRARARAAPGASLAPRLCGGGLCLLPWFAAFTLALLHTHHTPAAAPAAAAAAPAATMLAARSTSIRAVRAQVRPQPGGRAVRQAP